MSQLLDSVLRQQRQRNQTVKGILKFHQSFAVPQCDNHEEEVSFEPNISSNRKVELSQPEKQFFKGDCLNPDPDQDDESRSMLQVETKQKVNLWVHGGLRIMFYITKFSKQMKTYSTEAKFKSLTNNIVNLIQDAASDADVLLVFQIVFSKFDQNKSQQNLQQKEQKDSYTTQIKQG